MRIKKNTCFKLGEIILFRNINKKESNHTFMNNSRRKNDKFITTESITQF